MVFVGESYGDAMVKDEGRYTTESNHSFACITVPATGGHAVVSRSLAAPFRVQFAAHG